MAKKSEVKEKKVNTKKVNDSKVKKNETKKVKEVKKAVEEKTLNVKEDVKVLEKEAVVTNEVNKPVKDYSKIKKIIKIVIYSLIGLLIVGAFVYSIIETSERNKYFNTISFNKVEKLMKSEDIEIIYWASPNCGYCEMFTPTVKEVSYENKLTFNYLNTANLTNDQYTEMINHFTKYDESYANGLGTPSLIFVQNGEIVNITVGALAEEDLMSLLKTYSIVE